MHPLTQLPGIYIPIRLNYNYNYNWVIKQLKPLAGGLSEHAVQTREVEVT